LRGAEKGVGVFFPTPFSAPLNPLFKKPGAAGGPL
jgi:hypothetical protein